MTNIANIEDLLEVSANLHIGPSIQLSKEDITIMHSISKQVFKGTALTDRQFALMKEKLLKYKDQFIKLDCDFDYAIENLRQPLRHIDRSKYIKIVDYIEDSSEKGKYVKIRFPFKKSDIMLINEITSSENYFHKKGSHSHYFSFTESNIVKLLDRFVNKEFIIDEEIKEVYFKAKSIQENTCEYLSGIKDNKLINISSSLGEIIKNELGEVDQDNLIKFVDRKRRYGFNVFDIKEPSNLTEQIAYRNNIDFLAKPSRYSLDDTLNSLWNLDRFPMIVILDEHNCEEQLHKFVTYYRDIMPSECQSVLFRTENSMSGFNQLIKDRKLNNWVDKYTKIVYTSTNKLPKVLLKADWSPITAFSFNSRIDRSLNSYIGTRCDLVVYREEELSPMRRYSQYYG